jgi:Icc-related predicted phosphoesterase
MAGDVCVYETMERSLKMIGDLMATPVVYVLGNHECYGSSIHKTLALAKASAPSNIHLLENDVVELRGRRFVGCTLWFPYPHPLVSFSERRKAEQCMNDFHQIKGLREDVNTKNMESARFLSRETRPGDVVVTHHLPGDFAVNDTWKSSSLNQFFIGHVENVIRNQKPALWVHGHSHESLDTMENETRVIRNPFGYVDYGTNRDFKHLVVEL